MIKALAPFVLVLLAGIGAYWVLLAEPGSAPAAQVAVGDFPRVDADGNGMPDPTPQEVAAYPGPGPTITPGLAGVAPIASEFELASELIRNSTVAGPSPDEVGAFRFLCQAGQLNWDDPIVYPGRPNASPHLHQWFGNTAANALSTFHSLRTTGESTCMGPLNRSAYWVPAMLTGDGQVVRPDYISIYYKRLPKDDPNCAIIAQRCLPLPHGLRYIFGFDMMRIGEAQPENLITVWRCLNSDFRERGTGALRFDRVDCPVGHSLMALLHAPACWDGRNLDSPDHRSHMAYVRYGEQDGQPRCPASHPNLVPEFTISVSWQVHAGDDTSRWHLASDRMPGMPELPPGGSFHSDWYGAWDDRAMRTWTANCIDRHLSCAGGQLGDGTGIKQRPGFSLYASPRLVQMPRRPDAATPHAMAHGQHAQR